QELTLSQQDNFAVQTQNLRKVFGGKVAVRDLTLTVRRGEIFGFLGPNGAGKSTSIKMLLGLAKPTSGEAFVLGAPSGDVEIRRRIGFLPENFRFYEWLTPAELLHLHGRLCGVSSSKLAERVPALIDLVGLTPHIDKRLQNFSKGMLQRIGLAQALIHEPEVIFLDEPTSGLDPLGRRMVRDIIRAQRDRGATVFLNSHLLSEIEITCDQVVFIREGEVVTSRDMRTQQEEAVRVEVRARKLSTECIAGLARWSESVQVDEERLTLTTPSRERLPDILRFLVGSGAEVYQFTPQRMSLEELFMNIMGEDRGF
ncbi:MAG TPA: ABC transporter ATP-binding protein, partial [Candidatus Acidoferrales bacterium]|nr:ABC transporter ATP-binding protein [Candidatus Acidoferrales bacterium]